MPKKDLRQMKKAKNKKSKLNKEEIRKAAKNADIHADVDELNNGDIQNVEETIAQYENKSEDELMGDLQQMISKGKEDGTFNNEMLDAFIKNVSPMMDSAQRKKLESITKMIKMNKI